MTKGDWQAALAVFRAALPRRRQGPQRWAISAGIRK